VITVITCVFVLLVGASTVFARFLIWLLCITEELTEVFNPGLKVYIDVAVIAVGFEALWLMVLLGYQGWMTLSCAVHKITVFWYPCAMDASSRLRAVLTYINEPVSCDLFIVLFLFPLLPPCRWGTGLQA